MSASGARVQYCGHDGWFVADIYDVADAVVVRASSAVTSDTLHRPSAGATHHLRDFPKAGFWRPDLGVFVVPTEQLTVLA